MASRRGALSRAFAPRRTSLGAAALAWLLCAGASPARADSPGEMVRLSWVRAPGAEPCLSEAALVKKVAARLGRDPFSDQAARSIEGLVVQKDERFSARIYVRDEKGALLGVREIDDPSPSCGALDEAVSLAVALAIDPEAALKPPAPAPAEPPPAPSASAPPSAPGAPGTPWIAPGTRSPPPVPRAASAQPDRAFGVASIRALLGVGLLPRAAAGVASSAEVGAGRVRATAGLLWFPEVGTPDDAFGFGLAAGALGACFDAHRASTVRLGLCASALAGAVHAVTYKVTPTRPGDRPWAAVSLASRLEVQPWGPLTLHLGLEGLGTLIHYDFFVIGRAGTVFEQPPIAAIASGGVGVTFP